MAHLPDRAHEQGQATVESALVLPMLVFALLGAVQLSLAYQARILTEYAAFKAARAASVYRLSCERMTRASLMALLPTLDGAVPKSCGKATKTGAWSNSPDYEKCVLGRYQNLAKTAVGDNQLTKTLNIPKVIVDYRLENRLPEGEFDRPLDPASDEPMQVHVKVTHFFEYRIPFAGSIMSRFWLAAVAGGSWANADPAMLLKGAPAEPGAGGFDPTIVQYAKTAMNHGYFTTPIVSTWSMRMMSDPLWNKKSSGRCK